MADDIDIEFSRSMPRQAVPREITWHESRVELGPVVTVETSLLRPADSPRLDGENIEHIHSLAELEDEFPPILVHRATMRVVDGMHRLRAVAVRGGDRIQVQFVDGDEEEVFVLAVQANIAHGLPLSLADRKAAAARLIDSHPHWSDRMIAHTVGLSHKTVGTLRRRPSGEISHLDVRVGRDGRERPVNGADGRRLAAKVMEENPGASLREVAKVVGISPETARDVRARLKRGEEPARKAVGGGTTARRQSRRAAGVRRLAIGAWSTIMQKLKRDPSLRHTESGRVLLRLLDAHEMGDDRWQRLADTVPAHCAGLVAAAARECSGMWQDFAAQLEREQLQAEGKTRAVR